MTSPASESWLRQARRRAGYQTVGAFARAIGVDVSTAGRYETGQIKTIPARRLHHIARALRLPQSEVWQRLRPDLTPPAENRDDAMRRAAREAARVAARRAAQQALAELSERYPELNLDGLDDEPTEGVM